MTDLRRLAEAAKGNRWYTAWSPSPDVILALLDERDALRAALQKVVETGTRNCTVQVGDMYDLEGGYEDYETVSEEAEVALAALDAARERSK